MRATPIFASLCVIALALGATTDLADARPRPKKGKKFVANKDFGLGIMLGAPSGLSGKYFYSEDKAIDFGVGVIGRYRNRDGLHLHVDHLWHPVSLLSDPAFELPLYVGVGARFFDWDDRRDGFDDGTVFGLRAPVGIAFDFTNQPLDIFFELAFVLDFYVNDYYEDNLDIDLNGAIGIRYWF